MTKPRPPHDVITDLSYGYLYSAALFTAVELGVADQLESGPKSVNALAEALGVKAQPLMRILRLLATAGVFTETDPEHFALTPAADILRNGAQGSMRDAVMMMIHEMFWAPAGKLSTTVRTGETPFVQIFGGSFFDYLARNPEAGLVYHRGMAGMSDIENAPIASAYDFTPFRRIVDVGGGHGGFLVEALRANPTARGVLHDAEHVLNDSRIAAEGLSDRCEILAGDFFASVPHGDAIILKRILHDWSDDSAIVILRACRKALDEGGRVLVIDAVLPPGDTQHLGKVMDVMMMVSLPGRERTEDDFARLFAASGLRLNRIVKTPTHLSIVEAVAA
ncbi:methyltransferase [Polyangium aurulentum]|uniref:methyltransferase n=1 Tax=Polyangium aurulentum TaxID=2567896 RepID=UPI0010ADFF24|nr:methyltransferase [Polyangium aurulentum]UQA62078.1 SAM-dependent methyltransferase [Polyangium aurulentum]